MSTKKTKRNKTGRKKIERKIPDINVAAGEGYYATIEKIIGGNRLSVKLHTGEIHEAIIRGRDRNKNWMRVGQKVLLNEFFEIEEVIRDTNMKAGEAEKLLRKNGSSAFGVSFQDYDSSESESDSEEDEDDLSGIKKATFGDLEKTKKMLDRKEKVKEREALRRTGKQYTDIDVLEIEKQNIAKITNDMNLDDFNIDDI